MLTTLRRVAAIVAATALAAIGVVTPASAAATPWTADFAAGDVCTFPLTISGSGDSPAVYREIKDGHGNVRAVLSAGQGQELTFTNAASPTNTFSTPANGAASWTVYKKDGSQNIRLWGHNVVLMSPTDVGGASATLYSGLVIIKVNAAGVWKVVKQVGTKLDICSRIA